MTTTTVVSNCCLRGPRATSLATILLLAYVNSEAELAGGLNAIAAPGRSRMPSSLLHMRPVAR